MNNSSAGHFVFAVYRPKPGKDDLLLSAVRDHLPILRAEGFVTDRAPVVVRAADGTLIEMFEWLSNDAIARAHENPAVRTLWERFDEACEYIRLADLPEAALMFPHFEVVAL